MSSVYQNTSTRAVPLPAAKPAEIFATPFKYRDPSDIPCREWIYGRHLIRKNVSLTVAPGGVGKSSLTVVQALELVTGRNLLGHWNTGPCRVWLFNLEDERNELDRRIIAAMKHHNIDAHEIGDRLFVDTGREQELIFAHQIRDEVLLNVALIEALVSRIKENEIDVLIVDPFVSSHRVNEMDNGKIDCVTKEWIKLSEVCNCAVELVHHTRKLNGHEASSDSSRGASSLVNAARSSRVLQRLPVEDLKEAGVFNDGCTYFSVLRDKSNLASSSNKETFRTVSVDLGQGDTVGVVEVWKMPNLFDGISSGDLEKVQKKIEIGDYRYSDQSGDEWVGIAIALVLGLDPVKDRKRIKRLIEEWLKSGALKKENIQKRGNGKPVPYLRVGERVRDL